MVVVLNIWQNAGFFSCCSVILHHTIEFFNKYKKIPDVLDTTNTFFWYKPMGCNHDIRYEYFENEENEENKENIDYKNPVDYKEYYQFSNYKHLDYVNILPFINKYFTPSKQIKEIIQTMETKYNIDYNNLCVLFYRGNDKSTETKLCNYNEYIEKANAIKITNPQIQFLIQSDETEFIETMLQIFPDSIYFKDEIRHIHKTDSTTVDKVFRDSNHIFSKYYLAITIIMSKCHMIVCGSGNCSIWIMLFRGNANNVHQIMDDSWL